MYINNKYANMLIKSAETDNYNIYFISKNNISDYWYVVNQGVSDMANLLGITYTWAPPTAELNAMQIEIINNAVKDGADAIIISVIDPVRISSAIENAKSNGVKIIYVDSPANVEGIITLATDNFSAGVTAGENMIFELAAAGYRQGSIGIIDVGPGDTNTHQRDLGFRSILERNANYIVLDTKYGPDIETAVLSAESYIENYPDLVGLFGTNEYTTLGIGYSIRKSNAPIVGIGFDYPPETQQMIQEGVIKATMVQNQYTMGYLGMAETVAALKGYDTGPPYINTGITVRTKYTH